MKRHPNFQEYDRHHIVFQIVPDAHPLGSDMSNNLAGLTVNLQLIVHPSDNLCKLLLYDLRPAEK